MSIYKNTNTDRFPFVCRIEFRGVFNPELLKERLSHSRVNSVKFIVGQNDIIRFKYDRPIDWMGFDTFNPDKPAYTNVANITYGHVEKTSSTECVVRMRFKKWLYYLYLIPVVIPLILLIRHQDVSVFLVYIPLFLGFGIPTLIFYVRSKRYFKLFCQALES